MEIENFQSKVCVCAASTNLTYVKPRKCRVTNAAQKWRKEMKLKYQNIISQMSLEEKCYMFSGKDFWQTRSVERVGIKSITLTPWLAASSPIIRPISSPNEVSQLFAIVAAVGKQVAGKEGFNPS